MRTKLY